MTQNPVRSIDELTPQQLAKRWNKHVRTINRMIERGDLTALGNGKIAIAEIEEVEDETRAEETEDHKTLAEARGIIASQHKTIESLVKLVPDALSGHTKVTSKLLQALRKEQRRAEKDRAKTWGMLGDILLKKEERKTEAQLADKRAAAIDRGVGLIEKMGPRLLDQITGSKGELSILSQLKAFGEGASEEEAAGLWIFSTGFEGDRQKAFEALLTAAGIPRPKPEIEDALKAETEPQK